MRKIEVQMVQAIEARKDWKLANTRVEFEAGNNISRVYLHNNLIAEVGDGFITLFDGGWQSVTTKSRLNAIIKGCGGSMREGIFQKSYQWFIRILNNGTETVMPFVSGITLH